MKDKPRKRPEIKKERNFESFKKIINAARVGKSIKISALAILPSRRGTEERNKNITVVILDNFSDRNFFDKRKNKSTVGIMTKNSRRRKPKTVLVNAAMR